MIKAYENVGYGKDYLEEYIKETVITRDAEIINNSIKHWMQHNTDIDFIESIILSDIVDNEKYLKKMALVKDFSYRNCCLYLGAFSNISGRSPNVGHGDLESAYKEWEKYGFEELFVMIDNAYKALIPNV